jgi:hypothetical protein
MTSGRVPTMLPSSSPAPKPGEWALGLASAKPIACAAMASAGATHLQLVVDPITMGSIKMLGEVPATLDRD